MMLRGERGREGERVSGRVTCRANVLMAGVITDIASRQYGWIRCRRRRMDGRTDGRTDYRSLHRDLGDLIPSSPFRCSGPSDKPAPSVLPIPRENVLPSFLRQCHRHVPEPSSSARVASMSSLTRPPLQQFVPWRPQSPRVSKEEERLSLKAQVRRPTRERL